MNLFSRAIRSVIRKPMKSILLFLVVFMISLFLLSGAAGRTASIETQDKTRSAVGAGFLLEINEADRHRRLADITARIDGEGTLDGVTVERIDTIYGPQISVSADNAFETLKLEDIQKLSQADGICDYNITTAVTPVNPVNFLRIQDADVDQHADLHGVCLIGNRDMQMDPNVLSGNLYAAGGRLVQKGDADVCVISQALALQNGLAVGDRLQFSALSDTGRSAVHEAEIVGIYATRQSMTPYMSGDTFRPENMIFTDLNFPEKAEGESSPVYEKAYFQVEDARAYDSVKENLKQIQIDWERYDLIDNNGNYETMSANFNDLEQISNLLLAASALVSFCILSLIFLFWLKSRVQEVGVFLAMGIPKRKIIGQMIVEAVLISAAAAAVSFAAAPKAAEATAEYLVNFQIRQVQEQKELDAGRVAHDFVAGEETVNGVGVSITAPMMVFDGVSLLVLVGLSVGTAGVSIVRKSPKDILSEMS